MKPLRRGMTRNSVLIAIAVVALLAAGLLFIRPMASKSDAPTDQYVSFICQNCKEHFRMNYREFEVAFDKHRYAGSPDGRTMLFKCPKCGQMKAARADDLPPAKPK